jgi:isoquinoline 1-oxidoreductase beta subunit
LSRRRLLAASGGLTVLFASGCSALPRSVPVIPKRPAPTAEDGLAWVRFDGGSPASYTLYLPRVEMGQNIATALKQIACEELGITWAQLRLKLPHTSEIGRVKATVGSDSVKDYWVPLAQACATLRDAVAAGQTRGELRVQERPVQALRSLAAGQQGLELGFVGRSPALEQGEAIVRGLPLYVADVRRPGMVFGRVLRAPATPELPSRPRAFNADAARQVRGFVGLVQDPLLQLGLSEGLGVVATTPAALDAVAQALAVDWAVEGQATQDGLEAMLNVDTRLAQGGLRKRLASDGVDPAAPWTVDLGLEIPLAAHSPIEPRAAVAEWRREGRTDTLQLWVGSQDVFYQRDVMCRRFGLNEEAVVVHGLRVGGAFGGKTLCTVEMEAAVLARAAQAPVKVQWTRAQELRQGFHRPASSHRIRARVANGQLADWWHAFTSGHILFTNAVLPRWLQALTDFVGDDGVARGALLPYRAERQRIEFEPVRLPVFTGPWRGLGAGPNALAIEMAIDECARQAGLDPVAFRLSLATHPRLATVLKAAVAAAPAAPLAVHAARVGRGVACGIYKGSSYAAVVADVSVAPSGQVRVTRLTCAHDCGRVVNPDQVKAQCEGNLVWGLGMVLTDQLGLQDNQIAAASLAEAHIPRMADVPPMRVVLLPSSEAPGGAGETVIVAAPGAIANAIRAATGVRLQRLPVAPGLLRA